MEPERTEIQGYRKNAKPPEKPKELLYKKPWWQIWTPKKVYTTDSKQKYVWYYTKKWDVLVRTDISLLYYTNTGIWVTILETRWGRWLFWGDTLELLTEDVKERDSRPSAERTAAHFYALEKLIELKEKEDVGESLTIRL